MTKKQAKELKAAKAKAREALNAYNENPTLENRRKMASACFTMLCMLSQK